MIEPIKSKYRLHYTKRSVRFLAFQNAADRQKRTDTAKVIVATVNQKKPVCTGFFQMVEPSTKKTCVL